MVLLMDARSLEVLQSTFLISAFMQSGSCTLTMPTS